MIFNTFESLLASGNRYGVIVADPPWQYGYSAVRGHIDYTTMPINDMCAMDVASLTEDNAIMFMWTTNPMLKDGLRLLEAWGFEYKTSMVWVKNNQFIGHYAMSQHEPILIGVKGKGMLPAEKFSSVFKGDNRGHSVKPIEFIYRVKAMYPDRTRLEMFARVGFEGWDLFGNQAEYLKGWW